MRDEPTAELSPASGTAREPGRRPAREAPGEPEGPGQAGPPEGSGEPEGPDPDGSGKPEPKSPWDDPRLPWSGKPGKADIACWLAIVLSGFYYLAILPWRASLVGTHPVISELLNGSTESIIAAAAFAEQGRGLLATAILAAIPGLMKFDIIYWWAGRLWGERVIGAFFGRSKRAPRYLAMVKERGWRFTWPLVIVAPFLPIPTTIIYIIAGIAGMGWLTFLVLDLIGTLAWIGVLTGLGYALGHRAVVLAQDVSRYSLWITIGLVVIVVARQVWVSRRKA